MKIQVMNEGGISPALKDFFIDGILEMLDLSGREYKISDLGTWKSLNWGSNSELKPFNSVDWYVVQSLHTQRNQLNAQHLLALFACEPWQDSEKHLDIFLTNRDLYVEGTNYVLGLAIQGIGAVISTNRFLALSDSLRKECLKTLSMHEMGHVLGIVPDYREIAVTESLGKHCQNKCLMRQGLNVQEWIIMTQERLQGYKLCDLCRNDLKAISYYLR